MKLQLLRMKPQLLRKKLLQQRKKLPQQRLKPPQQMKKPQLLRMKPQLLNQQPQLQHPGVLKVGCNLKMIAFFFAGDENRKTWSESIEYCHTLDAYLAEVHDGETQSFLENHASKFSKTSWWLGASDQTKEGQWVWTRNDNQVEYTKWDIGEPNNGGIIGIFGKGKDCLYISSGWKKGYPWNELNCSQKTSGGRPIKPICQKSIM